MANIAWITITYVVFLTWVSIFADEEFSTERGTKNIDELQNDVLFNFHAQRERERNSKRKRSASPELLKMIKRKLEFIENSYEPIIEWSQNNLRFNRDPETEEDAEHFEVQKAKPVKREANTFTNPNEGSATITSNSHGGRTIAVCDMEQLMTYLAQLQAINPESIINLSTQQDIDALCHRTVNGLDNIDTYLRSCTPPSERDLYLQLVRGVRSLSRKICFDKKFRKDFLKQASCLSLLHNEYKDCVGPSDWVENPNSSVICKTYKDISNCYYVKTLTACGEESASIMKMLLKYVMDSIVPVDCRDLLKEHKKMTLTVTTALSFRTLPTQSQFLPPENLRKWADHIFTDIRGEEGRPRQFKRQYTARAGVNRWPFGPYFCVFVSLLCHVFVVNIMLFVLPL